MSVCVCVLYIHIYMSTYHMYLMEVGTAQDAISGGSLAFFVPRVRSQVVVLLLLLVGVVVLHVVVVLLLLLVSSSFRHIIFKKYRRGGLFERNDAAARGEKIINKITNTGAVDYEREMTRLREKIEAGAEMVMTQPVYDSSVMRRCVSNTLATH